METFLDIIKIIGIVIAVNVVCTVLVAACFRLYNKRLKKKGDRPSDPEALLFLSMIIGPFGLILTVASGIGILVDDSTIRKRIFAAIQNYAEAEDVHMEYQPSRGELNSKIFEQGREIERLNKLLAEYMLIHGEPNVGSQNK